MFGNILFSAPLNKAPKQVKNIETKEYQQQANDKMPIPLTIQHILKQTQISKQ